MYHPVYDPVYERHTDFVCQLNWLLHPNRNKTQNQEVKSFVVISVLQLLSHCISF
jgi:hypothetical protein